MISLYIYFLSISIFICGPLAVLMGRGREGEKERREAGSISSVVVSVPEAWLGA